MGDTLGVRARSREPVQPRASRPEKERAMLRARSISHFGFLACTVPVLNAVRRPAPHWWRFRPCSALGVDPPAGAAAEAGAHLRLLRAFSCPVQAALKKYQTEQRSKGDSLDKCQAELKKLRKKSQGSKNPQKYSDKELQVGPRPGRGGHTASRLVQGRGCLVPRGGGAAQLLRAFGEGFAALLRGESAAALGERGGRGRCGQGGGGSP